jgi:hypothetical protein
VKSGDGLGAERSVGLSQAGAHELAGNPHVGGAFHALVTDVLQFQTRIAEEDPVVRRGGLVRKAQFTMEDFGMVDAEPPLWMIRHLFRRLSRGRGDLLFRAGRLQTWAGLVYIGVST